MCEVANFAQRHNYSTVEGIVNLMRGAIIITHELAHHGDYHNTGGKAFKNGLEPEDRFEED